MLISGNPQLLGGIPLEVTRLDTYETKDEALRMEQIQADVMEDISRQHDMIPEQSFVPHGYIRCSCTPDMLEHIETRKEAHEDVIEYQCTCCGNLTIKVHERITGEHQMT